MIKRVAVLVSGGLDSFLAWCKIKKGGIKAIPLHINYGQEYFWKEESALAYLDIPAERCEVDLIRDDLYNVPSSEEKVAGLNMMLVSIAAARGFNEIWFGSTKVDMTETNVDKNSKFLSVASDALSYCFKFSLGRISIKSPFENETKMGAIQWALNAGVSRKKISKTASCVDTQESRCGDCIPCVRRWGIFSQLGIEEHYVDSPWASRVGMKYISELLYASDHKDESNYSVDRWNEVLPAVSLLKLNMDRYRSSEDYRGGLILDAYKLRSFEELTER